MEAKTKLQKRVVSLKLPKLTTSQIRWAQDNCFKKVAYLRKNSSLCMECGKSFPLNEMPHHVVCPHCNTTLETEASSKRTRHEAEYFSIITTKCEFQVLRHFVVQKWCKSNEKARYEFTEVTQNWINEKGEITNVSRLRANYYSSIPFSLTSDLILRGSYSSEDKYQIFSSFIYPIQRVIPNLKRNGYNNDFHDISPYSLFSLLLSNSIAETLLKSNRIELLKSFCVSRRDDITKHWSSVKIALRNNYPITKTWLDYIGFLETLGIDKHNPKVICPLNLVKEHNRLSERVTRLREREREQEKISKALRKEAEFRAKKERFFDIVLQSGAIKVEPLKSIQEFIDEGKFLKHCVFSSDYYKREDSLILSARIKGEPIETIELSLQTFEVVQSRGLQNKNSKHHNKIVSLVNSNKQVFKTIARAI